MSHEPTILVTGFGKFLNITKNPSWELACSLPASINGVRIISLPEPLKAEYHSLLNVTQVLDTYLPDAVIHIGLAADRNYFAIEKGAKKEGYHEFPDEERKVFLKSEMKKVWGKSPEVLESTIEFQTILGEWKGNLKALGKAKGKEDDLRVSDDVGNYVCGFVYYVSLEWFWRRNGGQGERPVLFFHVPSMETQEEIESGKKVTLALIKAVVAQL